MLERARSGITRAVPNWVQARLPRLSDDTRFAYKLLLPAFVMMGLIHFLPIIWGFYISFVQLDAAYVSNWWNAPIVGFENYAKVFNPNTIVGAEFWTSLRQTLIFTVGSVMGIYTLGLATALLLNRDFRGKLAARTLVLVPWIAPAVVTVLTWQMMFRTDTGMINHILRSVGLIDGSFFWLIGPRSILAITAVWTWQNFPWAAIMLYAGLQSIPEHLYEAAETDGAGRWGKFRYITMPQLKPVSVVIVLLMVVWTLINFTVPYVLLGSSPSDSGKVLMLFIYNYAFTNWSFGLGAAMSAILFIVAMILAYIYYSRVIDGEFEGGAI
ncbi:sugar ABC transporter permease (plasmid) [Haloferax mediterranei ATCC 33500]|uniref:Sugar ABC transport system permease protein n=2 Tax=Haloferax mediterranei (strain ATCC 33500 / DSM 1411 / JCM 8866 / NBRC 14739 / NCIMB 2177 / R-4) TaxID=523841 RepID=I3R9F8_HALMT|nr:sugar ABC transporter permease [Haloferax mediterranei]AFK20868.1 sugar ABC transport system permease protein [Haloferax mediterranei ATCC 33500]AHZ24263.1 sugar ABC transporter permease [Haloferax mediterranei ATCC 33500]MDX5989855.1 sugar ABC transporter permease [Haloferax mediterranei ATCC 33500]QCQ77296.1 sugar ABC transporter permease [Haloferax mediterranei ATCC 33500]